MQKSSFFRSLALAGAVTLTAAGAALAGGDHMQHQRAAEDAAYWQGKPAGKSQSGKTSHRIPNDWPVTAEVQYRNDIHNYWADQMEKGGVQATAAAASSDVSAYPCTRCVYDHARGGYVPSSAPRHK